MALLDCGHEPSPHSDFTTGFGYDSDRRTYCYACCAEREQASMVDSGRAVLYLSKQDERWAVTDWPGTLRFPTHGTPRRGRHNMARVRYDFTFTGPDGRTWAGTQYGDNTQIAHCRRLKSA